MNFELIKSYILAILVLISLLLTFSLWNYKPNYEHVFDTDYVDEINLGGTVKTKADVVKPESIIFKRNDNYFSFDKPSDNEAFYREMQSWVLYDFWTGETTGPPQNAYQVEVIFPTAISLDILPSLFDMDEEPDDLPEWSFQRMYITMDEEKSILNVHFLSIDGRYRARAEVTNAAKQEWVKNYIDTLEGMVEYIPINQIETPTYIRKDSMSMLRHTATINTTDQISLVNALFSDPSAVRTNIVDGDTLYTDGQRQMHIYYNRRLMEFVNPYQVYERMSPYDLLERSRTNINDYNGWTDSYNLQEIDPIHNRITYQMYYKGYPVFNNSGLATIEQEWRDQELIGYKRPLFSINDPLGGDEVELPSGNAVKTFLQKNSNYDLEKVENIKIGYRLSFQDSSFYTLNLEPVWYVKYNGKWQEINMEDTMLNREVN